MTGSCRLEASMSGGEDHFISPPHVLTPLCLHGFPRMWHVTIYGTKALRGNFARKFPRNFPRKSVHFQGNFLGSLLEVHCTMGLLPKRILPKKLSWKFLRNVHGKFPRKCTISKEIPLLYSAFIFQAWFYPRTRPQTCKSSWKPITIVPQITLKLPINGHDSHATMHMVSMKVLLEWTF